MYMINRVLTHKVTQTLLCQAPRWATTECAGLKDDVIPSLIPAIVFVSTESLRRMGEVLRQRSKLSR